MLVDDYLSVYDVSDAVATVVETDVAIYSLSVRAIDQHRTMLTGVMRTATTDEYARRCFRRYWTLGVGSGAHVLVNGLLDVTRELAESRRRA